VARDLTAHKPLGAFTVDHFRRYALNLILDNQKPWIAEDFQLFIVEDLFAGADEVWAVVPEGSAKTTLMGGVALYHGDYTPDASVLLGASSRDQCGWLFDAAGGFVHRSPGLKTRFKVQDGSRRIKCLRTGGRIRVFAADERTGDGVIPTLALLDELHRHRDLRLYRTWRGKLQKRNGQLVAISTAGEPDSEFELIREQVRTTAPDITVSADGAHVRAEDANMVLHDWSVPAGEDIEDMKVVKRANPLSTVTPETLGKKWGTPTMSRAHWRRFVCNQAVRVNESAIEESEWASAKVDDEIPEGEPIDVGIDFGWKHDTTAMTPLWWRDREYRLFGKPEIIVPPMDGTATHPSVPEEAFRRINERNPVRRVVLDDAAGGEQFGAWLEDNFPGLDVVAYSHATTPMCLAYERFMGALREGWIKHTGDPDFTRHVLNAIAQLLPDGRVRFNRASSSRAAVMQAQRVWDALDAAQMVHAIAATEDTTPKEPLIAWT
jgi:phage terminase large subunit-like protein